MPLRSTLNGAQYHVLTLRILATPARIGIQRGREFLRIQEPRRKDRAAQRLDDTLPDSECGFELWFAATGDLSSVLDAISVRPAPANRPGRWSPSMLSQPFAARHPRKAS